LAFALQKPDRLIPGIPAVNNYRLGKLARQANLLGEGMELGFPFAIVVVKIQTAFAHSDHFWMFRRQPYLMGRFLILVLRFMGVQTKREKNTFIGVSQVRQLLNRFKNYARIDHLDDIGIDSPLDDLFLVFAGILGT